MPTRKLSILLLLASLAVVESAMTIEVFPAEDAAFAPVPEGRGSPIDHLVSGCLDAIFEAGHIATDATVSRMARDSWLPMEHGMAEAREGAVDFAIAFYVTWAVSSFHKDASLPASVEYNLVRVLDGKVLLEGMVEGPADSESASSHEASFGSRAGASIAEPCMKMLSTLAMGGE